MTIHFFNTEDTLVTRYRQQAHLAYNLWIDTVPKRNKDILVSLLNNILTNIILFVS